MTANPVRLDRLQEGLFAFFTAALAPAQVGWAYGQAAFESMPGDLVNLTMTAGPSIVSLTHQGGGDPVRPFTSLNFRVLPVVVGQRVALRVNEITFAHDVIGGDTPSIVRDALLTALGSNAEYDPWTVAAALADELTITPTGFGEIWSLELGTGLELASQILSSDAMTVSEANAICDINIQTFSKSRELRNGAAALMSRALAALKDIEYLPILDAYGVGLWGIGNPVDISAIAGGNWETRMSATFVACVPHAITSRVDVIQTVNFAAQLSTPDGTLVSGSTIITVP